MSGPVFFPDGVQFCIDGDYCLEVSPHIEIPHDLHELRFKKGAQVPEYPVCGPFMGMSFLTKPIQVQFQGFELHDEIPRDVLDPDCGEIGIAGPGTEACKLRKGEVDPVTLACFRIGPSLEDVVPDGLGSIGGGGLQGGCVCGQGFLFLGHDLDPFRRGSGKSGELKGDKGSEDRTIRHEASF